MRLLRWTAAGLLGLLGGLLGLVGVLLCVTLILLPLGIPVIMLARKLWAVAGTLVVPRAVRHPVDELDRAGTEKVAGLKRKTREGAGKAAKAGKAGARNVSKKGAKSVKRGRKRARRLGSEVRPGKRGHKVRRAVRKVKP